MQTNRIYLAVFTILVILFGFHNYSIYSGGEESHNMSGEAVHGQKLWQDNNCFSCHQLYGLGGYLGPDLTNVYSADGKGPAYIKGMLNSGVLSMPEFRFSEDEKNAIVAYLKEVDTTGYYPNHDAELGYDGWVEITKKNE